MIMPYNGQANKTKTKTLKNRQKNQGEKKMENQTRKKTEEALAEIYRNAQLALQSIADITPQVDDNEVREELARQHEIYEQYSARASMLAKDLGVELKEPNMFKKAMMWGSIKMNTLTDNSRAQIAEMMIQGTVMGITSLRTTASELPIDGNDEIIALLNEMIEMEEGFEKKLPMSMRFAAAENSPPHPRIRHSPSESSVSAPSARAAFSAERVSSESSGARISLH